MSKLTFDRVERILNECGVPEHDKQRVPKKYSKLYGTWLRKHDRLKFVEEFTYMTNVLIKVNKIRNDIQESDKE
jgi:hypothetical protein